MIKSLDKEISELAIGCVGTIIVGDMNIDQKRWIRLTPSNSVEGSMLQYICAKHNLRQMVDKPIHGQYTIDLTLTSTASAVRTSICGKMVDREGVLVHVSLAGHRRRAVPA